MAKYSSEKSKAWEKDRRDRLNKTYEELAKLLPFYDPSVIWSKVEIIQKAIAYITDLKNKQEQYQNTKDTKFYKEYKEILDCVHFYQQRHAQLTTLIQVSKIPLPPLVIPDFLDKRPDLKPFVDNDAIITKKEKRRLNRLRNNNNEADKDADEDRKENSSPKAAKRLQDNGTFPTESLDTTAGKKHEQHTKVLTAAAETQTDDSPNLTHRENQKSSKQQPKLTLRRWYRHSQKILQKNIAGPSQQRLRLKVYRRKKPIAKKRIRLNALTPVEPIRQPSLSPTAAFLLSFPVVCSSGKNVENSESSVGLENLNNFFATEEYSKYCDQNSINVAKMPAMESDKPLPIVKSVTEFTVSAITGPSIPKKMLNTCDALSNKRLCEDQSNRDMRCNRITGNGNTFESCFDFTNVDSLIGPSTVGLPPLDSTIDQQVTNAVITSFSMDSITSSNPFSCQPTLGASMSSGLNQKDHYIPPLPGMSSIMYKPQNSILPDVQCHEMGADKVCKSPLIEQQKPATENSPEFKGIDLFYSPTKNFLHDLPSQGQTTSTLNFNLPPLPTSTPTEFPIFPSTPNKFLPLPSLPPFSSNKTLPSISTTSNCTMAPFDIVSAATDVSSPFITFSTSTTKSLESNNLDIATSKQTLFLPYEDLQFTQPVTVPKSSEPCATTPQYTWKPDKPKNSIPDQLFYECEQSKTQPKVAINWMTGSTTSDFTSNTTLPTQPSMEFNNQLSGTSNLDFMFLCRKDSFEENQSVENTFANWSPTKSLNPDFSTTCSFENFTSHNSPPNKVAKQQIFSVSQLVEDTSGKKTNTKKPQQGKQNFSNIYSAESLIAKKNDHHNFYTTEPPNTQTDYNNPNHSFFQQTCSQVDNNDYMGVGSFTSMPLKTTSSFTTGLTNIGSNFSNQESGVNSIPGSSNSLLNANSLNSTIPFDSTYFPTTSYAPSNNWNAGKGASSLGFPHNQPQPGLMYSSSEQTCQQNSTVPSSNLTNFNLSSIFPEIDKDGTGDW